MIQHRVAVTGLGAVTPFGVGVPAFWSGLLSGKSAVSTITRFDLARHKTKIAGEVKGFDALAHFDRKEARRLTRFVQYAVVAGREAFKDSGLDLATTDANEIGVFVGSGIGGLDELEEQARILNEKGPDRVSPFLIPKLIANMAPGQISIHLGLKGPNSCAVTACATGTHSIGDAFEVIKRGDAVAMIAGGAESAITSIGIAGFENMMALSSRNDSPETASRPFDATRDGFVMGEGAGVLVLESWDHAKARGAKIYAEITGYGLTGDAFHITAPAPEGEGAARAMRMALRKAGLQPTDIDHINAHGTSTELNDKLETQAIKTVFGEHAYKIAVSSNKSMIGHLLGAAGGVEAIATCLSIQESIVPPTINLRNPDPACDLDYVPDVARPMPVCAALSNSFGFGGHNASILFRRAS